MDRVRQHRLEFESPAPRAWTGIDDGSIPSVLEPVLKPGTQRLTLQRLATPCSSRACLALIEE